MISSSRIGMDLPTPRGRRSGTSAKGLGVGRTLGLEMLSPDLISSFSHYALVAHFRPSMPACRSIFLAFLGPFGPGMCWCPLQCCACQTASRIILMVHGSSMQRWRSNYLPAQLVREVDFVDFLFYQRPGLSRRIRRDG